MQSFRAVYSSDMSPAHTRFAVHVIAYQQRFTHRVNVPSGVACYFLYLLHDKVEADFGEGTVTVQPNSFVIYPPYTPLRFGRSDQPWRHSWLRCSGTEVAAILHENNLPLGTSLPFDSAETNVRWLLRLHEEMHHPLGAVAENTEALFRIWMRSLRRELGVEKESPIPAPFRKAKQAVETSYRSALRLDELAAACNLSRSHLCRGFRKYFDCSPLEYAMRLRMQHAEELLGNLDLNITEIAALCGFGDVYHFSKIFKQRMGKSPSAFRKGLTE